MIFYILTVVLPYLFQTVRLVLCYESNDRSLIKGMRQLVPYGLSTIAQSAGPGDAERGSPLGLRPQVG
jgi:hypothetical protein